MPAELVRNGRLPGAVGPRRSSDRLPGIGAVVECRPGRTVPRAAIQFAPARIEDSADDQGCHSLEPKGPATDRGSLQESWRTRPNQRDAKEDWPHSDCQTEVVRPGHRGWRIDEERRVV